MIPKSNSIHDRAKDLSRALGYTFSARGGAQSELINGIVESYFQASMQQIGLQQLYPMLISVFLENSGHYPHVETPELVLKAFFEFHDKMS